MSDGMNKLVYVSDVVSAIDDIVDTMSVCPSRDYCDGMRAMKRHIKQKIDELDSVNMVPIVRCGECESGIMDEILNEKYCNGEYHALDWFCADGKRKSDERSVKCPIVDVLPVRLGSQVWQVMSDTIREGKVSMLQQKADGTWKFRVSFPCSSGVYDYKVSDIGKCEDYSIHLSKAMAERALLRLSRRVEE